MFHVMQNADLIKTKDAIFAGHRVIRIDYSKFDNIDAVMDKALAQRAPLFCASSSMYKHLGGLRVTDITSDKRDSL